MAITDDFSTIPFHLVLGSSELVELAKSIPVHSLILAFRLFSLHLLLFPFIVLCRIVFAKPVDLQMWQKPPSCQFLDQGREFIIFSNGCLDPFANLLIGNMVLVRNAQKHLITSQRPTFFSLTRCQSLPFIGIQNMEMTRECISFTFDPKDMLLSLQIGFSFVRAAVACTILERI